MIHFSGPRDKGVTDVHWINPNSIEGMSKLHGFDDMWILRVRLKSGSFFEFCYETEASRDAEFKIYFDQWVPVVEGI